MEVVGGCSTLCKRKVDVLSIQIVIWTIWTVGL